jgi:hypothetical protein
MPDANDTADNDTFAFADFNPADYQPLPQPAFDPDCVNMDNPRSFD